MSFKTANLNSVVRLRATTDERFPSVLATLGYSQSHLLEDTRLAIGYTIAAISALTFYLDKKMKFEEALPYTKILLVLYAVFSGVAWVHSTYVEKNIVYRGSKKSANGKKKQELQIEGTIDKYIPEYKLKFTIKPAGADQGVTKSTTLEFKDVFDKFGNLHDDQLVSWVKSQLDEESKEK